MADHIIYHRDFEQGSGDWAAARCGLLTASEIDRILTPTLKTANNDTQRLHFCELLAQRITRYVEPHFVSEAMMRGNQDELVARELYSERYEAVEECGFVTNSRHGFTLGYSPDGLVGSDGLIEIKSRAQKYQVKTIVENAMPGEFMLQVQCGLLVTERKWCDFISYSGGLPMFVTRVMPDADIQAAIVAAATAFEAKMIEGMTVYAANASKFHNTQRIEYGSLEI